MRHKDEWHELAKQTRSVVRFEIAHSRLSLQEITTIMGMPFCQESSHDANKLSEKGTPFTLTLWRIEHSSEHDLSPVSWRVLDLARTGIIDRWAYAKDQLGECMASIDIAVFWQPSVQPYVHFKIEPRVIDMLSTKSVNVIVSFYPAS